MLPQLLAFTEGNEIPLEIPFPLIAGDGRARL